MQSHSNERCNGLDMSTLMVEVRSEVLTSKEIVPSDEQGYELWSLLGAFPACAHNIGSHVGVLLLPRKGSATVLPARSAQTSP